MTESPRWTRHGQLPYRRYEAVINGRACIAEMHGDRWAGTIDGVPVEGWTARLAHMKTKLTLLAEKGQ